MPLLREELDRSWVRRIAISVFVWGLYLLALNNPHPIIWQAPLSIWSPNGWLVLGWFLLLSERYCAAANLSSVAAALAIWPGLLDPDGVTLGYWLWLGSSLALMVGSWSCAPLVHTRSWPASGISDTVYDAKPSKWKRIVLFMIAAGLQIGAVVLGHFWDSDAMLRFYYGEFAELAGLLTLFGMFIPFVTRSGTAAKYPWAVSAAALVYGIVVVWLEPFLYIHEFRDVVVAALVLFPLLLAIGLLVRAGAWLSVAGLTLFVLISSAMVASNARDDYSAHGFFAHWSLRT